MSHLVFVWASSGYALEEREGELPPVGSELEEGGRTFEVTKIASSPLPGDTRPCVYVQPA